MPITRLGSERIGSSFRGTARVSCSFLARRVNGRASVVVDWRVGDIRGVRSSRVVEIAGRVEGPVRQEVSPRHYASAVYPNRGVAGLAVRAVDLGRHGSAVDRPTSPRSADAGARKRPPTQG